MIHFLRNLPFKKKLTVMVLTTSIIILLVACASLFTVQLYLFKKAFARDLVALAKVVAANSVGPLSFHDTKAAEDVVASLKDRREIVSLTIHLPDGSRFIHSGSTNPVSGAQLEEPVQFSGHHCLVVQPIELNGEYLGSLHLEADFDATYRDLLALYTTMLCLVLGGAAAIAALVCTRLQRVIAEPIQQLASAARRVGDERNYSVRATKLGSDEIGQLTDAFNQMLDRLQDQDRQIRLSQEKIETLIHSIEGIVWEAQLTDHRFTFVSQQAERLLGYPTQAWLETPNFWEERLHPDDREAVLAETRQGVEACKPFAVECRMVAASGQHVWVRSSTAILSEVGQPTLLRGVMLDITDRKRAEAELARLNAELLSISRQAGMAEVATGVLHNVGNVLNSVNVSCSLVHDKLRKSKVASLIKTGALLQKHQGDLARFFTSDPQGQLVPEFLIHLGDYLQIEQRELLAELQSLGKNIEHIKEIVAMQQSYARASGITEHLPPAELVEDAVRLNAAALERHRVRVVRQFARVPNVLVDKHKVLQILVNLIRNAKYAMEEAKVPEKLLTLRVEPINDGRIKIEVQDNGIGIASENLLHIFQHGFTTKKDGHGFGLHSGANAAKEMGGCLSVQSAGPGCGATFTLELPIAATNPLLHAA